MAPVVTGIGVATAFGYGKDALLAGLFAPRPVFGELARPGRQLPGEGGQRFIGAELAEPPALLPAGVARITGLVGRVAVAVVDEAWREAGLDRLDPERIGLVVGGAQLQSRELVLAQQAYAQRLAWLPPRLAYTALDTDLCGLCSSHFPIRGFAMTVGGASASGAVAVVQAMHAVRSGRVDACIAVGALQDLSYFDLQAMRALGALSPGAACRPFDRAHDGFMYGEGCAALVVTRPQPAQRPYGRLAGAAHLASGHRGPDPSPAGELRAIRVALAEAGVGPGEIDYVNAHGTGTPLGDRTEAAALLEAGLHRARVNATKSLVGHGLAAAGAVELAALFLQMRQGRLHGTQHLQDPIEPALGWVRGAGGESGTVRHALKLSFGFGGFDTAIVASDVDA